jgi:metal-responsive CopG/Arc/MetJ family transcriptional regulator
LNRVVINLPQQQVSWIDEKVHGIENRTTFLRRLIQQAMESDKRQQDRA